jgi:UDP-N-acetyl-D-glucosamine dehydrogenase
MHSRGQSQNVHQAAALAALRERTAKVGVMGMGYVGLPLSLAVARAGYTVLGFDTNHALIDRLKRADSFINYLPSAAIAQALEAGQLEVTADLERLGESDVILICVPTPLARDRTPDLSHLHNSAKAVAACLRPGQLIVVESTSYPGTSDEVVKPILEESGMRSGIDFFLAYSPERQDPGNTGLTVSAIPKVIGGDGDIALALADAFYSQIVPRTVPVSAIRVAEAAKLTENIFRAVNIALINELKMVFLAMGIDVWEVIEVAKTKPFGFMPFYPGPGFGGHCIPIDPYYLTWKARQHGVETRFIELAGDINTEMPAYVIRRLEQALDKRLSAAKILVVGLAYKKNVADTRESASFRLIDLIEGRGGKVDYHDPLLPIIPPTREYARLAGRRSVELGDNIASYDAVVIATDHDVIDFRHIAERARLIIDTRNACATAGVTSAKVVKA